MVDLITIGICIYAIWKLCEKISCSVGHYNETHSKKND